MTWAAGLFGEDMHYYVRSQAQALDYLRRATWSILIILVGHLLPHDGDSVPSRFPIRASRTTKIWSERLNSTFLFRLANIAVSYTFSPTFTLFASSFVGSYAPYNSRSFCFVSCHMLHFSQLLFLHLPFLMFMPPPPTNGEVDRFISAYLTISPSVWSINFCRVIIDRYALPEGADPNQCPSGTRTWCGGTWNS